MKPYYTPAMEGEKPFRCYVCDKLLMVNIQGEYELQLKCNKCYTEIILKCREPLPNILVVKHGELTHI